MEKHGKQYVADTWVIFFLQVYSGLTDLGIGDMSYTWDR